jgi:hypothetical protein
MIDKQGKKLAIPAVEYKKMFIITTLKYVEFLYYNKDQNYSLRNALLDPKSFVVGLADSRR